MVVLVDNQLSNIEAVFLLIKATWWYWLLVGLGGIVRLEELRNKYFDIKIRFKKLLGEVGIVIILAYGWNGLDYMENSDNYFPVVFFSTIIYAIYGLAKKCDENGGTTESIL